MQKIKYTLETEQKMHLVDEEELSKRRHLASAERNSNSKDLLKEQQIVLKEYLNSLLATDLKPSTIENVMREMYLFSKYIKKPFSTVNRRDIEGYIAFLRKSIQSNTAMNKIVKIKQFYKWINNDVYPDFVKWIITKKPEGRDLKKEELLTKEDVEHLIKVCDKTRDKTIVALLYEGGVRLGEIISVKIQDVEEIEVEDNTYYKITVKGKTGTRTLLFIYSAPYVDALLRQHHYRDVKKAPLFYNEAKFFGRQLTKIGVTQIIQKLSRRADLNKKIYPHIFRHTRLTELAEHFSDSDLRIFAGWTKTSNMTDIYNHRDETDVHNKQLELAGVYVDKKVKGVVHLEPVICWSCQTKNISTNYYCSSCDEILREEKARKDKADRKIEDMFGDPDFQDLLKEYMRKKIS